MSLRRTQFPQSCIALIACLFVTFWFLPSRCSADDLFVGNFFGPGNENVLRYNGTTGAFISTFVPDVSFPLGGAFEPDGNLYVSNSDTETVLRFNGTTGAFINNFATPVDDAAGLAFGPANNLFVANSASPGSVTELNAATGALINTIDAGGLLSNPEGVGPDKNLYVANGGGNNVLKFNGTTGAFIGVFVASGSGGLVSARGVAFGPDGDLYVTGFGTNQVLRYDGTTGAFVDAFVTAVSAARRETSSGYPANKGVDEANRSRPWPLGPVRTCPITRAIDGVSVNGAVATVRFCCRRDRISTRSGRSFRLGD